MGIPCKSEGKPPEIDYDKINSKLTRGANTRIEELQTEVKTLKKQDSRLAQRIFELEKQLKTNKTQKITEVEPGIVELLQERKPVYMTIAELENQLKTNKKQ